MEHYRTLDLPLFFRSLPRSGDKGQLPRGLRDQEVGSLGMREAKAFGSDWRCSLLSPRLAEPTGPRLSSPMEKERASNGTVQPG